MNGATRSVYLVSGTRKQIYGDLCPEEQSIRRRYIMDSIETTPGTDPREMKASSKAEDGI
jgi:hypothetical protein